MHKLLLLAVLSATALPVAALAQSTDGETAPAPATAGGEAADSEERTGAADDAMAAPVPQTEEVGVTTYVTEQPEGALFATDLIGQDVFGSAEEKIGDINDILIGGDGMVEAVVIGVGGFLGLGEKDVAVPLSSLEVELVEQRFQVSIPATEQDLMEAPMFLRADGTTSDRLGAFERMFERTRVDAEKALDVAGERAGELYDQATEQAGELTRQAGESASRLLEQGGEALRQLTEEETPPADQPADGGGAQ